MAQTTYTSTTVTLATRRLAYEKLVIMLQHLDALNLNLQGVVLNANNTVTVTLSGPIPADLLSNLRLD